MIVDALCRLGAAGIDQLAGIGRAGILLWHALTGRPSWRGVALVVRQLYAVGVLSLIIILVAGLFIGMVLGLQGYTTLVKFGAEGAVGPLVALSLVRELGPVVAALLFAGRAGSALTAEIALMKATEQLSSMEMMAVDPLHRIVAPRFIAGFLALPLLSAVFTAIAILGGYGVCVLWLGTDPGQFWSSMQSAVEWDSDVINGLMLKSFVFSLVITWIALYRGYDAAPTSEGISLATTRTVVQSSLAVLGLDFILTALMFGG